MWLLQSPQLACHYVTFTSLTSFRFFRTIFSLHIYLLKYATPFQGGGMQYTSPVNVAWNVAWNVALQLGRTLAWNIPFSNICWMSTTYCPRVTFKRGCSLDYWSQEPLRSPPVLVSATILMKWLVLELVTLLNVVSAGLKKNAGN